MSIPFAAIDEVILHTTGDPDPVSMFTLSNRRRHHTSVVVLRSPEVIEMFRLWAERHGILHRSAAGRLYPLPTRKDVMEKTHVIESHDLHGRGDKPREVYYMPLRGIDYWAAVTDVECPVRGCGQTVVWYEAGYVPSYRVCMKPIPEVRFFHRPASFNRDSIRHRFLAQGDAAEPCLVRDNETKEK